MWMVGIPLVVGYHEVPIVKCYIEAEKREIFNWLSTIDFRGHHEKAQNQRFDGTGTWLFENPTFESWIETDSSSVMWLSGKGIPANLLILFNPCLL